ncbi:hypothetical protein BOX15_Mlig019251g1, partial [Macrostomum lignano]
RESRKAALTSYSNLKLLAMSPNCLLPCLLLIASAVTTSSVQGFALANDCEVFSKCSAGEYSDPYSCMCEPCDAICRGPDDTSPFFVAKCRNYQTQFKLCLKFQTGSLKSR